MRESVINAQNMSSVELLCFLSVFSVRRGRGVA